MVNARIATDVSPGGIASPVIADANAASRWRGRGESGGGTADPRVGCPGDNLRGGLLTLWQRCKLHRERASEILLVPHRGDGRDTGYRSLPAHGSAAHP